MDNDMILSQEAIWYYSMGSKQPSLLQVLSRRLTEDNSLQMILYDGLVCAGFKYDYSSLQQKEKNQNKVQNMDTVGLRQVQTSGSAPILPQQFDVVRVQARKEAKNELLNILSLKIIQTGLRTILGQHPITLQDYIKIKFRPTVYLDSGELGKPTKHVKQNEERVEKVAEQSLIGLSSRQHPKQTNIQNTSNKIYEERLQNEARVDQKRPRLSSQEGIPDSIIDERNRVKLQHSTIKQERLNEIWQQMYPFQQKQMIREQPNQQKEKLRNQQQNKPTSEQKRSKSQYSNVQKRRIFLNLLQPDSPMQPQENNPLLKLENESIAKKAANFSDWKKSERSNHYKIQRSLIEDHILIKDLIERMSNFKLICTVNYLERFQYQEVKEGISMMLIDEVGDEIKCVLFARQTEVPNHDIPKLEVGRTYVFENGAVELEDGTLKLTLAWDGFREIKVTVQSFNPNKMNRVGEVQHLIDSSSTNSAFGRRVKQVNVCGIFTGFKKQPSLNRKDKNNYLVVGGLCDPLHQKQINFSLFINNPSIFPQAGTVLTLHNMELVNQEGVYKLYSTRLRSSQSYCLVQTDSKHQYLSDLVEMSKNKEWKLKKYSNLSNVYAKRTFGETKQAIGALSVGDKVFFQIECKVRNFQDLKEYNACSKCNRSVKPFDRVYAYCNFCRKNERWTTHILFNAEATFGEEIIHFRFNSKIIDHFLRLSVEDYSKLTQAERNAVLLKINGQRMVLRGKSERTAQGCRTYVNQAERIL